MTATRGAERLSSSAFGAFDDFLFPGHVRQQKVRARASRRRGFRSRSCVVIFIVQRGHVGRMPPVHPFDRRTFSTPYSGAIFTGVPTVNMEFSSACELSRKNGPT